MAEFAPTPGITDALRGTFSAPIDTTNPKGEPVTVRFSINGSGQWDIPHVDGMKKTAGIMHHSILTGRYSHHVANGLLVSRDRGLTDFSERIAPNIQALVDAEIDSHAGRITGEDARDYPGTVDRLLGSEEGTRRRGMSYEALGLEFIAGKIPQRSFDIVSALGHGDDVDPEIYKSLDYKIASYVDHRTTDRWQPLDTRMANFLLRNYFNPDNATQEVEEDMRTTVREIITKQRRHRLEGTPPVSFAEAEDKVIAVGAETVADRGGNRGLMVQFLIEDATTEAELIIARINPDAHVPMPSWEKQLRREYVASAAGEFIPMVAGSTQAEIDTMLPLKTWWGQTAREIYNAHPERKTPQIQVYPDTATI